MLKQVQHDNICAYVILVNVQVPGDRNTHRLSYRNYEVLPRIYAIIFALRSCLSRFIGETSSQIAIWTGRMTITKTVSEIVNIYRNDRKGAIIVSVDRDVYFFSIINSSPVINIIDYYNSESPDSAYWRIVGAKNLTKAEILR